MLSLINPPPAPHTLIYWVQPINQNEQLDIKDIRVTAELRGRKEETDKLKKWLSETSVQLVDLPVRGPNAENQGVKHDSNICRGGNVDKGDMFEPAVTSRREMKQQLVMSVPTFPPQHISATVEVKRQQSAPWSARQGSQSCCSCSGAQAVHLFQSHGLFCCCSQIHV